jgi:hypothetical protein
MGNMGMLGSFGLFDAGLPRRFRPLARRHPRTMLALPDAALCYPLITAAHILEEWRGFPGWAQRFASPRYSRREYVRTHVVTIGVATVGALLVRVFPGTWSTLAFFGFFFGPAVACNACFHLGASALTRTYCPGAVTSAALYLPATLFVTAAASAGGVSHALLAAAFLFAAVLHVVEVGHNVFKRW